MHFKLCVIMNSMMKSHNPLLCAPEACVTHFVLSQRLCIIWPHDREKGEDGTVKYVERKRLPFTELLLQYIVII